MNKIQSLIGGIALVAAGAASAESAVIIKQPGSPLLLETYTARYQKDSGSYQREGIRHDVKLSNVSDQAVVAYKISFKSFDVFNEDMGRGLGGISVDTIAVGDNESGAWVQKPYSAFTFKGYGTGVAYVSAVRLQDGSVWSFNEDEVLKQLQAISSDLTAEIFEDPGKD